MNQKNYKIILCLVFLSNSIIAQNGFRINKKEFFNISTSIDPTSSIKEKGLDIVGELEYVGFVYVKFGFESFSALTGGYTDLHGGFGINFTSGRHEKIRYYGGIRIANVWREDTFRTIYGLETGIDYKISNNFFTGLRATFDHRNDQEIHGWIPELKFSGFIRLGYRWDFKGY